MSYLNDWNCFDDQCEFVFNDELGPIVPKQKFWSSESEPSKSKFLFNMVVEPGTTTYFEQGLENYLLKYDVDNLVQLFHEEGRLDEEKWGETSNEDFSSTVSGTKEDSLSCESLDVGKKLGGEGFKKEIEAAMVEEEEEEEKLEEDEIPHLHSLIPIVDLHDIKIPRGLPSGLGTVSVPLRCPVKVVVFPPSGVVESGNRSQKRRSGRLNGISQKDDPSTPFQPVRNFDQFKAVWGDVMVGEDEISRKWGRDAKSSYRALAIRKWRNRKGKRSSSGEEEGEKPKGVRKAERKVKQFHSQSDRNMLILKKKKKKLKSRDGIAFDIPTIGRGRR